MRGDIHGIISYRPEIVGGDSGYPIQRVVRSTRTGTADHTPGSAVPVFDQGLNKVGAGNIAHRPDVV